MPRLTLFAYFEDGDLGDRVEGYADLLRDFVAETAWRGDKPYVVSQAVERPANRRGEPEWDLGLHLRLPLAPRETAGWLADVEAIVAFLVRLRHETGHNFVVGVYDWSAQAAEELCYVDRPDPDSSRLRARLEGWADKD